MKRGCLILIAFAAAAAVVSGGDAVAKGGKGKGGGDRLRDGSCLTSTTAPASAATAVKAAPAKKGQMRKLGPGDGTGNVVPPQDGTGYGSPNTIAPR